MKFIAIHLAMAWIVLQVMPPSVRGGSLRGLSSLGGDAVIKRARTSLTDATAASVPPAGDLSLSRAGCPTKKGGNAEVWLGHHSIETEFDQAKIWVISSNKKHFEINPSVWKPITDADLPAGYTGGTADCTKYFTIGAGPSDTDPDKLSARISHTDDVGHGFEQAVKVTNIPATSLSGFKGFIDAAIDKVNTNFALPIGNGNTKTILKYETLPLDDWYKLGYDWVEFNANGFMSGLLKHLYLGGKIKKEPTVGFEQLHGWDKPIPQDFFSQTFSTVAGMKSAVYKNQKCDGDGSKAELWVGYHPITSNEQNVPMDHAKLWVISSNPAHNSDNTVWKELSRERVPFDYQGDKNCAKFYTLGWGYEQLVFKGIVNANDDSSLDLLGAKMVATVNNPENLLKKFNNSNERLKKNFEKNPLIRTTAIPKEFNSWGFKWYEFNDNGHVSGFLNYLTKSILGQNKYSPRSGNLIGWEKDVNMALFEDVFPSGDQVYGEIFREHPRTRAVYTGVNTVTAAGETPVSDTAEVTQPLEPNLSLASTPPELDPELEFAPPELEPAPELELTPEAQLEPTDDPLFRAKQL